MGERQMLPVQTNSMVFIYFLFGVYASSGSISP